MLERLTWPAGAMELAICLLLPLRCNPSLFPHANRCRRHGIALRLSACFRHCLDGSDRSDRSEYLILLLCRHTWSAKYIHLHQRSITGFDGGLDGQRQRKAMGEKEKETKRNKRKGKEGKKDEQGERERDGIIFQNVGTSPTEKVLSVRIQGF